MNCRGLITEASSGTCSERASKEKQREFPGSGDPDYKSHESPDPWLFTYIVNEYLMS